MDGYIFSEQCNESPLTSHKLNFIATLIGLINASYNRLFVMDTFLYLWSKQKLSEQKLLSTSRKCCLRKNAIIFRIQNVNRVERSEHEIGITKSFLSTKLNFTVEFGDL